MKTMKTQRVLLPLAFLSAAFMLGCQDQGLEPVGPEGLAPQFDKKGTGDCLPPEHNEHCHGGGGVEATFTATWVAEGDISGGPIPNLHESNSGLGAARDYTLDLTALVDRDAEDPDGALDARCFVAGTFTGPIQLRRLRESDLPQNAWVLFTFDAKGTNGSDVNYAFSLFGVAENDFVLPANSGESIVITWDDFKVKHNNGPGSKFACSGTGVLNSAMEVVRD